MVTRKVMALKEDGKEGQNHHGEPLRFPESKELCEDDAGHAEHEGELVNELHLEGDRDPSRRNVEAKASVFCVDLWDTLYVIPDPGL